LDHQATLDPDENFRTQRSTTDAIIITRIGSLATTQCTIHPTLLLLPPHSDSLQTSTRASTVPQCLGRNSLRRTRWRTNRTRTRLCSRVVHILRLLLLIRACVQVRRNRAFTRVRIRVQSSRLPFPPRFLRAMVPRAPFHHRTSV